MLAGLLRPAGHFEGSPPLVLNIRHTEAGLPPVRRHQQRVLVLLPQIIDDCVGVAGRPECGVRLRLHDRALGAQHLRLHALLGVVARFVV